MRERRLWWIGAPYDVTPAIARIRAAGHRIHVVTARDVSGIEAEALDATRHWLDRHGIDADTITLAQDKTSDRAPRSRPTACVAIDDGPHHVQAFEAAECSESCSTAGAATGGDPMATDLSGVADMIEEWGGA